METQKRGRGRPKLPPEERAAVVGYRLHPQAIEDLRRLSDHLGISQGKIIEEAVRARIKRERI